MPAGGVVEDLDVVEDLPAQLLALGPGVAVDELLLEGREEALGDGVRLRCRLRLMPLVLSELSV